jgi:DnaJ-class molecular chaperone
MKKPREALTEVICPACNGTGFRKIRQPANPGRKVYPPRCPECLGKGRIEKTLQQSGSAD